MSGRIYNSKNGIPICNHCGGIALTTKEMNFYGEYCPTCEKSVILEVTYDITHPIWIAWEKYLKEKQGIFADFTYGLREFKKDNGFTT
jgi:hypothetical protein